MLELGNCIQDSNLLRYISQLTEDHFLSQIFHELSGCLYYEPSRVEVNG